MLLCSHACRDIQSCAYSVVFLWLGQVTLSRCACTSHLYLHFLCVLMYEGTVSQSACHRDYYTVGLLKQPLLSAVLSALLSASFLFKQLHISDSAVMDAQPSSYTHTHTQTCTQTNICCATVKTDPLHCTTGCGGGWGLSVCLFVHLEVVCFEKNHCVGVDGGFGHVRGTTSIKTAKFYQRYRRTYI